ncbi:MAG: hypothetical protein IAE81_08100 [Caldilineaceae bacterium]|jgi:hypothetical protein|nr:hypothetical protein [Caldilineaceae bacterium]HMN30223.1 hypothetical protein [Caldilineaceae bacterium]
MTVKTLTLDYVTLLATTGRACDVDALMQRLDDRASFTECKLIDHALGLVEGREGWQQIQHYLFAGNPMQRNYAALFFKRRGATEILAEAIAADAIDSVQAYAR